jgi:Insertion element 4 transposase N-terminal/Transposase DDE domain
MSFDKAFHAAATYASPPDLEGFRRHISPEWVDEALQATGTATVRRRRLPSEQVIWVVLGMALFRDSPVEDVVSKLDLALPGSGTIARSSVAQARERVGSQPVKWLFDRCGATWAHNSAKTHLWRGLRLYGIDGTSVRVPSTAENREEFGGHRSHGTESGYPMVRIVVLMALRSHLLVAANFGAYEGEGVHEIKYAEPLCDSIPESSLTVLDRGYTSAAFLLNIESKTDRHWLIRSKSTTSFKVLERFGPNDELVEMTVWPKARAKDPSLPPTWIARRIRYQVPGFREQFVLTSLRDSKRFPAREIVALYHERWELELGYDEIKTEMLEREEAIRSKKPDGVRQELWGILLAYNLVRLEIESIATEHKIEPTRISFVESLRLIRSEWEWLSVASPGAIPKRLATLRRNVKRYILPPRRKRSYPRFSKINSNTYNRKNRPSDALK